MLGNDNVTTEQENQPEIQLEPADKKEIQKIADPKIKFDDFAKIEMRIGEIVSSEKVENADRLLKLRVDFGHGEERQIVSGIADFYEPENLIGLKCPFVTNLEPRTIRGEESNGMILAARDGSGHFSILQVDQKIDNGTKLS